MSFELNDHLPFTAPEYIKHEVSEAIPERCRDCGVQCELAVELGHALLMKYFVTHFAEQLVGKSGEEFDALIDSAIPAEEAASIKQFAREMTALNLDEIDTAIDKTTHEMADNGDACVAPLKMRASKEGTTYTVSVCTSSKQYEANGTSYLPAQVQAQPLTD